MSTDYCCGYIYVEDLWVHRSSYQMRSNRHQPNSHTTKSSVSGVYHRSVSLSITTHSFTADWRLLRHPGDDCYTTCRCGRMGRKKHIAVLWGATLTTSHPSLDISGHVSEACMVARVHSWLDYTAMQCSLVFQVIYGVVCSRCWMRQHDWCIVWNRETDALISLHWLRVPERINCVAARWRIHTTAAVVLQSYLSVSLTCPVGDRFAFRCFGSHCWRDIGNYVRHIKPV